MRIEALAFRCDPINDCTLHTFRIISSGSICTFLNLKCVAMSEIMDIQLLHPHQISDFNDLFLGSSHKTTLQAWCQFQEFLENDTLPLISVRYTVRWKIDLILLALTARTAPLDGYQHRRP